MATKQDLEILRADIEVLRAATKQDLEILRTELKAEIRTEIAEVKASLIRWMFGFFIGQNAIMAGLITGLFKLLK